MALPRTSGEPPLSDADAVAILNQVQLVAFAAEPATIVPFEGSQLSWEVTGPANEFTLFLGTRVVSLQGSLIVSPINTQTYLLRAQAGRVSRSLGSVSVEVDESACSVYELGNDVIRIFVEASVDDFLADNPELNENSRMVSVDAQGIHLKLDLTKEVENFANLHATIDAGFTYVVSEGELAPRFFKLDISVSVPWHGWWAYLIGGGIALSIAISMAKDDARDSLTRSAENGADQLEAFIPEGNRLHSVGFTQTVLRLQSCPEDPLRGIVPIRAAEARS